MCVWRRGCDLDFAWSGEKSRSLRGVETGCRCVCVSMWPVGVIMMVCCVLNVILRSDCLLNDVLPPSLAHSPSRYCSSSPSMIPVMASVHCLLGKKSKEYCKVRPLILAKLHALHEFSFLFYFECHCFSTPEKQQRNKISHLLLHVHVSSPWNVDGAPL